MLNAIIEVDELRSTLAAANVLVDECRLRFQETGLSITAADPATVALVEISLPPSAFAEYRTDGETLGVNLDRLLNMLDVADSNDTVELSLDTERQQLVIETGTISYSLALIDPDTIRREPDIPDIDPPARVALDATHLDRGITAADMISDHLRFRVETDAETFHIQAEGDTDNVDVELDREQVSDLTVGEADSLYSLDYLKEINRAIPSGTTVSLDLGEEFLVRLWFEAPDSGTHVSYRLAPRIQTA